MAAHLNPGTYECLGCGKILPDAESATLWFTSEFGLTAGRCCRTQECAKAGVANALAEKGWRLRPHNLPPMDREDREKILAERGKETAS